MVTEKKTKANSCISVFFSPIIYRYGPYDTKNVFVERKTHHAPWLQGTSVKDRFRIQEPRLSAFLEGRYTADQIADELRRSNTDESTVKDVHFIARGVQTSIQEKQLEPMLRVYYNRTAFQLPDDQRLRISLDTDLTFIREDRLDGQVRRYDGGWRRPDVQIDYPFRHLPESEVLRFPYAVLETKLQTHLGQEPPAWLTSLVESHLVHEVPRFSKYLHGACHFYRDRLPLLPWWLSELNVDIRKPRSENIGLTRSRSFKPLIDGRYRRAMIEGKERANQDAVVNNNNNNRASPSASDDTVRASSNETMAQKPVSNNNNDVVAATTLVVPPTPPPNNNNSSSSTKLSGGFSELWQRSNKNSMFNWNNMLQKGGSNNQRQKVKVRVEPKVFFANERTFISWLQFCALLLTVALSLLNFGDNTARIVGGIFIGVAAAVAIYALYRFEKRAW